MGVAALFKKPLHIPRCSCAKYAVHETLEVKHTHTHTHTHTLNECVCVCVCVCVCLCVCVCREKYNHFLLTLIAKSKGVRDGGGDIDRRRDKWRRKDRLN